MDRPAQLRSLLGKVVAAAHPGERLSALASLKRELDTTETEIAADALRAGLSWSQIGGALGVSKQAAHRRHSHGVSLLDQAAETQHRGRRAIVSSEARRAVRTARQEAAAMGERTVGTEHLLLGLLQCGDGPTQEVLHRLGITLALARDAVQPTMEVSLDAAARAQQAGDGVPPGPPPANTPPGPEAARPSTVVSPLARRVLEHALRPEERQTTDSLTALDLLEALLRHDNGGAARTLAALGVDAQRARVEIAVVAPPAGRARRR